MPCRKVGACPIGADLCSGLHAHRLFSPPSRRRVNPRLRTPVSGFSVIVTKMVTVIMTVAIVVTRQGRSPLRRLIEGGQCDGAGIRGRPIDW